MITNNKELKLALRNAYNTRKELQNFLIKSDNDKLSDELLDKIVTLNKIIHKAESFIDMNSEYNNQ